jgi:hypothetical protein
MKHLLEAAFKKIPHGEEPHQFAARSLPKIWQIFCFPTLARDVFCFQTLAVLTFQKPRRIKHLLKTANPGLQTRSFFSGHETAPNRM